MSQRQWKHKKAKAERKSVRDLKNLRVLPKSSAEGLGSRRDQKKATTLQLYLAVQVRVQLEHSSHIDKVSVKATC